MKNRYERHSLETEVAFEFLPAGERNCIETPCGFLNHMIDLFLHRAGIPGRLTASGDVEVDAHHLVEDGGAVTPSHDLVHHPPLIVSLFRLST